CVTAFRSYNEPHKSASNLQHPAANHPAPSAPARGLTVEATAMRMRGWCVALALLLTAAEASQAQVFINGRGGVLWRGLSYPVGPSYVNAYNRPFIYNPPPTGYSGGGPVTMSSAPTPLLYGPATMYSTGYSSLGQYTMSTATPIYYGGP